MKIYLIDDDDYVLLEQCVQDLASANTSFNANSSIDTDYEIISIQRHIDTIIDGVDCVCDVKLSNSYIDTDNFISHCRYTLVYSSDIEVLIDILEKNHIPNDILHMTQSFGSMCHAFIIKS